MEGLISLLLFAVFFYVMMRFGCGARMIHGSHGNHGGHGGHSHGTNSAADTDPVCGMKVAADQGYAKAYEGRTYRFCSRDCLDRFEGDPSKYANPVQEEAHHEHTH